MLKYLPGFRDLEVRQALDVAQDSTVRETGGNSSIAEVSAIRNSVWTEGSSTRADQSAMGLTWRPCASNDGSTS